MPAGRELYFVRCEGGTRYGGKTYEATIREPWKLLQNDPYSPLELYHLQDDPGEERDLIDQPPQIARELEAAPRAHIRSGGQVSWQPPNRASAVCR